MAEQILKTRIALRINDYAYWSKVEGVAEPTNKVPGEGTNGFYVPYRGEVCFCEIPEGNATATTAPTVLFKVGNGTDYFKDLKWASGLAADVYPWAKRDNVQVQGTGNAITNAFIGEDDFLTFEKGETFATKAELDRVSGTIEADTNTTYNFKMGEGDDVGKLVVEKKEIGDEAWTRVGAYDFVTPAELEAILADYYTKNEVDDLIKGVRDDIPTEVGVMSVGAGNAIEVTGTDANPVVNVKLAETQGNVVLTVADGLKAEISEDTIKAVKVTNAGHADTAGEAEEAVKVANALTIKVGGITKTYDGSEVAEADVDAAIANRLNGITYTDTQIDDLIAEAKKYADDNDANDNTAHTHTVGAGLVMTGEGGIAGTVEYSANIDVKYEGTKIQLIDKTTKAVIGDGFDASAFVKDSYLESVVYDDETNILTFTFIDNADNLEEIPVDLKDLVDVYTADEVTLTKNGAQFSIKEGGVGTEQIAEKAVTEAKLEKNVTDALALARTALQAADITGKADKVDGAVAGNFAGLDADGNLVDSGKKAADFDASGAAATAEQNAKSYADDLVKDYGDIVTHNAAEFATSAENGAKALADANKATLDEITDEENGILAQAKKDAGDKAAVVLGEAQKYADEKVAALAGEGNDTTVAELAGKVKDLEDAKHISEVEADTGLKVIPGTKGANNKVAIDTETVFILDCNW